LHIGLGIGVGIGIVAAAGALKSFSTALAAERAQKVQQTRPQAPASQALSNPRERRQSHYGHPIIDFLLSHNLKQSEM
jgi:hypothetical protein